MSLPLAETMPTETLPPKPKGLPIAITQSPIRALSESANFTEGKGFPASTLRRTMSIFASLPTILASSSVPSCNLTLISVAFPMTWLFVMIKPAGSITNPEPRENGLFCGPDGGAGCCF